MENIVIQGIHGRMGQTLVRLIAEREDCAVAGGIDVKPGDDQGVPVYAALAEYDGEIDVLVDFSHPAALPATLLECARRRVPCVVCTTGLSDADKALLRKAANETAVFYSANMSIGINLLMVLAEKAVSALPGFDVEIVEKHHHNKLDAPSGTALALADAINEAGGGGYEYVYDRHEKHEKRAANEIGLHAVRAGSIVGEHDVIFAGLDEVITLSHAAYSRDVFATGAIAAALFLQNKAPGLYDMRQMLQMV